MVSSSDVTVLSDAVAEIERYVAASGWDAPIRVFALINTAAALKDSPELVLQLPREVQDEAKANPHHLTSVEQEGLPEAESLEALLAQLAWPETVTGCTVSVERIVLPPSAEENIPEDPELAQDYLLRHPDRQDVRIVAGALRSGETWFAVRTRQNDDDDSVAQGPNVIPQLAQALMATFEDPDEAA